MYNFDLYCKYANKPISIIMRFTLLTSMALLGLALAAATESSTDDVGSTKVTDGTLDV